MIPKRCIILASGASILEGMYEGLFNYLTKEVTFSINENIKFFHPTAAVFGDWCAYRDRFELFSKHPLVIGRHDMHIGRHIEGATPCPKHDSLIQIPGSGRWHGDNGLTNGLYSASLTGAFTLNLAIQLGFKQIFLLGFDCCEVNGQTHWYQNVEGAGQFKDYEGNPYTGVGINSITGRYNTSFYSKSDEHINALWKPFEQEFCKVMIYNVSLESRISVFKKIGYYAMFAILKQFPIDIVQSEVQNDIRQILTPYNKVQ